MWQHCWLDCLCGNGSFPCYSIVWHKMTGDLMQWEKGFKHVVGGMAADSIMKWNANLAYVGIWFWKLKPWLFGLLRLIYSYLLSAGGARCRCRIWHPVLFCCSGRCKKSLCCWSIKYGSTLWGMAGVLDVDNLFQLTFMNQCSLLCSFRIVAYQRTYIYIMKWSSSSSSGSGSSSCSLLPSRELKTTFWRNL